MSGNKIQVKIKVNNFFEPQSDQELANLFKSLGFDKYQSWDKYIIALGLKPRIDAKEFYALYKAAPGLLENDEQIVTIEPTHIDTLRNCLVEIKQNNLGVYEMIWEDGQTGSNPPVYPPEPTRYIPLKEGEK